MNAWCSPTGIRQAHPSNEVNNLSRQGRAALRMATLPAPVQPKSSSMPGDHRFRFDDQQSRSPLTPESREPDPQEPVGGLIATDINTWSVLKILLFYLPARSPALVRAA